VANPSSTDCRCGPDCQRIFRTFINYWLATSEVRRALFQKGAHAFLMILVCPQRKCVSASRSSRVRKSTVRLG